MIEYPHRSDQQPGSAWLVWPAERELDPTDNVLLALFLQNIAGDPTTNLYKRLIDSKTREGDVGVKGVFAQVSDDIGHPVTIGFSDLPVAKMNERELGALRAIVRDELERIGAMKDRSPELAAFNVRMKSRLTETRRGLAKFVNSPPTFGFRSSGSEWITHLHELHQAPGLRKSLTQKQALAAVEKLLEGDTNIWTGRLERWKLAGVNPWVLATKANPELLARDQSERTQRVQTELERLKQKYGAKDDQETIRRYRADYDTASAVIERATQATATPKFVAKPPLTLDDQLDFKVSTLAGDVTMVASTFDSMTSATTGIALRLDGVPEDQLVYIAMLPGLLTRVGVIENGRPVSFEEMTERLKNEILSLNAGFSTNAATGRVELVLRGSGNDQAEALKALDWMRLALFHSDLRPENLARIRDVVDQALVALRRTMQRPEEYWVQGPATVYWRQSNPLLMATESFMSQTHNLLRMSWMLKEGSDDIRAAAATLLADLATVRGTRAELRALLGELQSGLSPRLTPLPAKAKLLAGDAARDLEATLPDVPDSSLNEDWSYLCQQMRRDLLAGPQKALADIEGLRRSILRTGNARMFAIGSPASLARLAAGWQALLGGLENAPASKVAYRGTAMVRERLRQREPAAINPVYVGLLNPNSQSGVFLNSAPLAGYSETDGNKLLAYLSTNIYGGRGAHGIFMKTWAAGLAYSNGIRVRPATGRLNYYAERTPELPQTLRFVVEELQKAGRNGRLDPALVEYAIAEAFSETRAAARFEARGEAMAADIADGQTSEVVARFRRAILDLRHTPHLSNELARRMNAAYGTVLPGLGAKTATIPDAVFFVIGPEKQFTAWEEYLKTVEGADAKLYRLYPRDFWMTAG